MDIVVTGIGLVSALGDLQASWKGLLAGKTAIRQLQPDPRLEGRPLALIGERPIDLVSLTHQVVDQTLADAGLQAPLQGCGVVVGSSRGNQSQWERLAHQFLNQPDAPETWNPPWLETLPHGAAVTTARLLQTQGPVLSPMAACATGVWAIAQGVELIRSGQCQRVIAGAIEAPISSLTLVGFDRMGALAQTGAYPFDCQREGLVLGEGGALLLLETAELAVQRQATIYGQLLGFGLTADGYHVSAPEPQSRAAIAAIHQCLHRSQIAARDVGYIHAHGTATRLNDRNEAHLIQTLFPEGVAVSSTKGATGHTIGASGALGVAFTLLALKQQILPPCVGLVEPEFDLDLIPNARPEAIQTALCFSFGFGGQNAVIGLKRWV